MLNPIRPANSQGHVRVGDYAGACNASNLIQASPPTLRTHPNMSPEAPWSSFRTLPFTHAMLVPAVALAQFSYISSLSSSDTCTLRASEVAYSGKEVDSVRKSVSTDRGCLCWLSQQECSYDDPIRGWLEKEARNWAAFMPRSAIRPSASSRI